MSAGDFYPGKRLSTKGNLCTVRYVGEIKGKSGLWLGVEWDDTSRGKHAGSFEGVDYFKCRSPHPKAASFIRPTTTWDKPRSFLEALRLKYAPNEANPNKSENGPTTGKADQVIYISGKEAEEVGFDKIARQQAELQNLRIVVLEDMLVSSPEVQDASALTSSLRDVGNTCPSITELDLSRNLFEALDEIASICDHLQRLRSLRIDGNRMRAYHCVQGKTAVSENEHRPGLARIQSLYANDLALHPEELSGLIEEFPSVRELSASGNRLARLRIDWLRESIESVTLEDNEFASLEDVLPLTSSDTNLRTINLKNNRITTISSSPITGPEGSGNGQAATLNQKFTPFTNVTELDLSYNNISSWQFMNDLPQALPRLAHFRISHNPLFENLQAADGKPLTSADGYMLTIARLPGLKTLNYSIITDKERLNAETYYLSQIAQEVSLAPAEEEAAILARHPRYAALCEEYGEPRIERKGERKVDPNSLAARLITCNFRTAAGISTAVDSIFRAELPKSFSVYSVLGIVGKHYGVLPMKLQLIWETGEKDPVSCSVVGSSAQGIQEWDSEDEDAGSLDQEWMEREVELVAGTRPLGTIIETAEASIRVEWGSDAEVLGKMDH